MEKKGSTLSDKTAFEEFGLAQIISRNVFGLQLSKTAIALNTPNVLVQATSLNQPLDKAG